ncbi:MAG: septum formation initiator family protein [Bacteroidetes bacterium]|jgi:cell division protein FtsB|nr:septum formation initiator family protein [Bacteroidota bacterium]
MPADASTPSRRRRLGRLLLLVLVLGLGVWIALLDSHSLVNRVQWHLEYAELSTENEELRQEIETLEAKLETPLTDEVVEQIAREEYGMRRPGETVYRVAPHE